MQSELVVSPDPRLTSPCEYIETIDDEIKELASHMLDVMYESDGVGLAAPQIGVNKQICVVDVKWPDGRPEPYVLINPKIVVLDGAEVCGSEGCLSFPGLTISVSRPSHIVVHAQDLEGKLMKYEASNNLLCVCLQHEIDHLNGITMVDRLSAGDKLSAMKKYSKLN